MQFIRDTMFGYFVSNECGQSSIAITLNPSQTDFAPPITLSGVSWVSVEESARVYLSTLPQTPSECLEVCDSYTFAVLNDEDGSLTGVVNSTVFGENPALAFSSPKCTSRLLWGAMQCAGVPMRAVSLSAIVDQGIALALGPIHIRRIDAKNPGAVRRYFSHGSYADMCAMVLPVSRFRFLMVPGYEHELITTNTLPGRSQFRLWSPNPSESILMQLFMEAPSVINMFVDGTQVAGSTMDVPTLADPAGSNQLNPQGE